MNRLYLVLVLLTSIFSLGCSDNNSPEIAINKANQALNQGEENKAIVLIKSAIQKNIKNTNLRILLGNIYLNQGDLNNAEKELNKAQELGASVDEWLLPLIQVNYLLNEHVTISHLWQEYQQSLNQTNFHRAHLYYAISLISHKKTQAGLSELNLISMTDEPFDKSSQQLANILAKLMAANIGYKAIVENISELKSFAENNPKDWLAWLLLSKAQYSFKDFTNSAISYQTLSELLPNYDIAQIYAAESNIEAGNNKLADIQLTKLLKLYPSQPFINQLSARNNIVLNNFKLAKLSIEKTLSSNFINNATKLIAGLIYFQLEEYENALNHLNPVVKTLNPQHPAKKILIATQLKLGYIDDAYSAINTNDYQTDSRLIASVANSLLATNKTEQASQLLSKANISQAKTPALAMELSRLKYLTGDKSALAGLEEVIKNIANNVSLSNVDIHEARTMELAALVQSNKLKQAQKLAETWLVKEPDNIANHLLLIEVMKRAKNREAIDSIYTKILLIDPSFISAKLYFAAKFLSNNELQNATELYNEILSQDPVNTKAVVGNYLTLLKLKQDNDAESFIKKHLQKAGPNSKLSLVLAKSHFKTGQVQKAQQLISQNVYANKKDNIEKFNIIATSHLKLGDKVRAIKAFNEILKITPDDKSAFTKKILTMEAAGQSDQLLRELANFKSKLPIEDPRIELMHAEYLATYSQADKSMEILNKYKLTDIAQNPIYKGILGKALFSLKDYNRAKSLLKDEYARVDSPRTAIMLYNTYMRTNAPDEAIAVIKTHISNHPRNIMLRSIYAEYLFNTNRDESIKEYKQLLELDKENGIALNNLAWIFYEKKEYSNAKSYIDKAVEFYPTNTSILDTATKIKLALKEN